MKILANIYMLPQSMNRFDPGKKSQELNLGIYEIPNIDEVDAIYLATSRGLLWGKIEPPDYILMLYSSGITYKFSFDDDCPVHSKQNKTTHTHFRARASSLPESELSCIHSRSACRGNR